MKRKFAAAVSVILMMVLVMTSVAYAKETSNSQNTSNSRGVARSLYLASAIAEITNKGQGVLEIYADFSSYEPVEEAIITIHLERWNESTERWTNVKDYEKTFSGADGNLTSGSYSFTVKGYTTGRYYRLNCRVEVRSAENGWESKSATTDGVLLTSEPAMGLPDLEQ